MENLMDKNSLFISFNKIELIKASETANIV